MRYVALSTLLFLLCTLLGAQQVRSFAPPKVEPPDKETAQLIAERTEALESDVARIKKLGVRDPNLADVEIFLKAALRIAEHNEYYKNGGKQTLAVLDQGLLRASQQGRGYAPWLSAPQGLTLVRAYRSRIDGSLQP